MRIQGKTKARAIELIKNECVLSVPRDIEGFLFRNSLDLNLFSHNTSLNNATQSQQYIMDTVDSKFEKLRDSVYKLGLSQQ